MNQVSGQDTYQGTPAETARDAKKPAEANGAAAEPKDVVVQAAAPAPEITSERTLTEADLLAIKKYLMTGQRMVATQTDLVEMQKRFVEMFKTLNQGVGEMYVNKAEKDRHALSERLDTMEEAVDRMEGALRIEFEPALRTAVADVMAEMVKPKTRWIRNTILAIFLIISGLIAGVVVQAQAPETVVSIVSNMETQTGNFKAFLSPNGGI